MFWLELKYQNVSTKTPNISIRKCCCTVPLEMEFQVSYSHFPLCPTIQLISLFPDEWCCITKVVFPNSWWDTHTREMNGDLRLQNTNKFPHHPFSLSRWKHFEFQEIVFKKKISLESKPFFKVSLIENLWFLSTGSFKTAIFFQLVEKTLLLSIIPDSHTVWVQLAISSKTSKAF